MGIHDPNAHQCFAGFTNCPWCGKEGQNEGMVVNHLRTMHYKLGLVCDKCFGCPTITSDTLHHHGHHNCHQVITPLESVPSDQSLVKVEDPYQEVKAEHFTQAPPERRPDQSAEKVVSANPSRENARSISGKGSICQST